MPHFRNICTCLLLKLSSKIKSIWRLPVIENGSIKKKIDIVRRQDVLKKAYRKYSALQDYRSFLCNRVVALGALKKK